MKNTKAYIKNPWAGLESYTDPDKSLYKIKFCGRDSEIFDVAKLIDDNFVVTLYGKSGIGKTSLLNAGVFPFLRKESYTPLSLRLGIAHKEFCFQNYITEAIEHTIRENGGIIETINVVEKQTDIHAPDFLWNYFARHRFINNKGNVTFPVVVLDQFEEIFLTVDCLKQASVLLTQLHYLMDESHAVNDCFIDGQPYYYDFNFRFVLSIREDDLYRLEDCIDNKGLAALKGCRFRLRSLTKNGARDAILIPGEGFLDKEQQEEIVNTIIDISTNKGGNTISTNVLSLICSRIFVNYQKSNADYITRELVDGFIKENPFEKFYNEATLGFSHKEKSFIENSFVDSSGRRNSMPEDDFLLNVKKGSLLLEGERKILQRTTTSNDGGCCRIELLHDSFCAPLVNLKQKRERRKRMAWMLMAIAIVLVCLGVTGYILSVNHKLLEGKARLIAEKAMRLIEDGDSHSARLVALEAAELPYTVETERALRMSMINNDGIIHNVRKEFVLSSDRKILFADGIVYNLATMRMLFDTKGKEATFSKDNSKIISLKNDTVVSVWDIRSGIANNYSEYSSITLANISPDCSKLALMVKDSVYIRDTNTGGYLQKLFVGWGRVSLGSEVLQFSPDGSKLLIGKLESTDSIKQCEFLSRQIFDVSSGNKEYEFVCSIPDYSLQLNMDQVFSPDGSKFVAIRNNEIQIIKISTGECLNTLKGHSGQVSLAFFTPDGTKIQSISPFDGTICYWDAETGELIAQLVGIDKVPRHIVFDDKCEKTVIHVDIGGPYVLDFKKNRYYDWTGAYGDDKLCNTVNISSDGGRIVSALSDGSIEIWNCEIGCQMYSFRGHKNQVADAVFAADNNSVVSFSKDGTVRKWDLGTAGTSDYFLKTPTAYTAGFSFSNDGKYIAYWNDSIYIVDYQTKQKILAIDDKVISGGAVSFNHDASKIISAYRDTVKIWDVSTGKEIKRFTGGTRSFFCSSVFSNQKMTKVYVGKAARLATSRHIAMMLCYNVQKGRLEVDSMEHQLLLQEETKYFNSFSYNNDYTKIVAYGGGGIRICDLMTGECRLPLELSDKDSWHTVYMSSDNKRVVACSQLSKALCVWDAKTGRRLQRIDNIHIGRWIYSVSSNPNATVVMTTSQDALRIWDVKTGICLIEQNVGDKYYGSFAQFSPDGKKIVLTNSFDKNLKFWDYLSFEELVDMVRKKVNDCL